MRRPRVALLNAAHEGTSTRRNFRRELAADLAEFDVTAGQLPAGFDFDAVVVSGSRSSVYWDDEWLPPLSAWVRDAVDAGLAFLGVCYGHQLLADVLGGRVEDMGEYELGYREIRHTGDSPLFDGVDERFVAFTTHSDRVVELPPGARRIAENDYGVQGFRTGDVFGVQFHPEYDRETAVAVTEGKDLPDERIESVLAGITDENYAAACETKQVFDNFLAYVRRRGRGDAANRELND